MTRIEQLRRKLTRAYLRATNQTSMRSILDAAVKGLKNPRPINDEDTDSTVEIEIKHVTEKETQ